MGGKLIGQFANNLAADIEAASHPVAAEVPAQADSADTRVPGPTLQRTAASQTDVADEIDLFALMGKHVPQAGAVRILAGVGLGWLLGRCSRRAAQH